MSSTLLISLFVCLPIVIIVAVVIIQSRKKSKKKKSTMARVYKDIILEDHLKITEEEVLPNKIFAVDTQKKVFVFVHSNEDTVYDIIYLSGLSGCEVERKGTKLVTRTNGKAVTELHVNEVYLSFLSQTSVLTSLRVYSEIYDGQLEYMALTKTAEQWQQKLNKIISEAA